MAQGPASYGAVTASIGAPDVLEARFCVVAPSGGADLDQCAVLGVNDVRPQVIWHDGAYRVFDAPRGEAIMRMVTVDEAGAVVGSANILPVTDTERGIAAAATVGEDIGLAILGAHDEGCAQTVRASRLALAGSASDSSAPLDLLEPRYSAGTTAMASSETGALLITETTCIRNHEPCQLTNVHAGFTSTFSDSNGGPTTRRIPFPGTSWYELVWDGERFVLLEWGQPLDLFFFDADGAPTGVASLDGLAYALPGGQLIGQTSVAVLAPGEYVIGYSVSYPAYMQHRVARVSVSP